MRVSSRRERLKLAQSLREALLVLRKQRRGLAQAWFNDAISSPTGIPTSLHGRSLKVGGLVTRSLWRRVVLAVRSTFASREQQAALKSRYHMQLAEEATETMGNMKGAFMKLGQIMSFAMESLPENARSMLERLQMDAPPMAFSIAKDVIEQDLGKPLSELFRSVDEEPLAAASIGQVHAAVMHDGTEVVIKVQCQASPTRSRPTYGRARAWPRWSARSTPTSTRTASSKR
jgi:predicted unusual protein kinase regulating ubiquinone biosynthesis (AarF/ABC1/UbiB family)